MGIGKWGLEQGREAAPLFFSLGSTVLRGLQRRRMLLVMLCETM